MIVEKCMIISIGRDPNHLAAGASGKASHENSSRSVAWAFPNRRNSLALSSNCGVTKKASESLYDVLGGHVLELTGHSVG